MEQHILVVDDDDKITALLRRSLSFEGYIVTTASDGAQALQMMVTMEPDLLILDVMMPNVDGFEVVKRLRRAQSKVPILMLTARDGLQDRVQGLDLGADDYLVKPFALEELLARVRALLRRNHDSSDMVTTMLYGDLLLDLDARQLRRGENVQDLTAKEFDLLHLFMENPGRVLSRDLLMSRVWGYDFTVESNVLEVYVAMLRQKMEEGGLPRLIQTIRGVGYVLRGDKS
jgi:two-component system response regulator MprA